MGRKRKTRQKRLPGMEVPTNKTIERAADEYVKARDKRMKLTEKEVETRAILIKALKDAKLTSYQYDGREVELTAKEGVKVKSGGDNGELDKETEELVTQTADDLEA